MSVDEIIHTCSNEKVAQAAVASIGFVFALRVKTTADVHGLTIGAFAARVVSEFGRAADERERKVVHGAMAGSQQPILCGLKTILERQLELDSTLRRKDQAASAWAPPASDFQVGSTGCCL